MRGYQKFHAEDAKTFKIHFLDHSRYLGLKWSTDGGTLAPTNHP